MLIAKELVRTLRNILSEQAVIFSNDNIVQNGARKISPWQRKESKKLKDSSQDSLPGI